MMGEPAYVLIVHSSDPTCGRGDNYKVEVYISGVGDVDCLVGNRGLAAAKLYVSIPAYIPETIKRDPKDERIRLTVKVIHHEYTKIETPTDFHAIRHEDFHTNAFDLTLPHYLFNRKFLNSNPSDLGVEGERIAWNRQWWLDDNYYYAPLSFSFTVAKNAPPGDHNIYFHLVYRDGPKWHSDCATLKIHIKQWYENDSTRFLVVLAAIASITSGLWALCNCFNGLPTPVRSITTIIAPIILILVLWGLYIFIARD
jgi:hypothetical protein